MSTPSITIPGIRPEYAISRPSEPEVDEILELVHACDVAATGFPDFTREDVLDELRAPFTTPNEDHWLVRDADGRLVAWAYVESRYGNASEDAGPYVHPDADPTIVRPLLDRLVQRCAERAAAADRPEHRLIVWCTNDPALARACAGVGATRTRTFARLQRSLDGSEGAVPAPPGITIESVDPSDESVMREFHAVWQESFTGHYGFEPTPYEAWRAHLDSVPSTPYDQWRVARDQSGAIVGLLQAADMSADGGGWVRNLGVLPAARGRGIARALLDAAFVVFRERGFTWAGLGVDTENDTGAYALYESVGLQRVFTSDCWELSVPAAS